MAGNLEKNNRITKDISMKKFIKSILSLMMIVSVVFICSCSGSGVQKVNLEKYFESSVEVNTFGESTSKSISLLNLTSPSPKAENYDSYIDFTLTANGSWLYKMYVEKICFYISTTEISLEELVLDFEFLNLADESEYEKEDHSKIDVETFTTQRSFKTRTQSGEFYCTIPINKVVTTPQLTTIKLDISNSVYGTLSDENGEKSNFKWQIYGLELYGESRAYSEK